jgi:hypothetical protein
MLGVVDVTSIDRWWVIDREEKRDMTMMIF